MLNFRGVCEFWMQNSISLYGQTKQHPSLTEKIQASTLWQFPAKGENMEAKQLMLEPWAPSFFGTSLT